MIKYLLSAAITTVGLTLAATGNAQSITDNPIGAGTYQHLNFTGSVVSQISGGLKLIPGASFGGRSQFEAPFDADIIPGSAAIRVFPKAGTYAVSSEGEKSLNLTATTGGALFGSSFGLSFKFIEAADANVYLAGQRLLVARALISVRHVMRTGESISLNLRCGPWVKEMNQRGTGSILRTESITFTEGNVKNESFRDYEVSITIPDFDFAQCRDNLYLELWTPLAHETKVTDVSWFFSTIGG